MTVNGGSFSATNGGKGIGSYYGNNVTELAPVTAVDTEGITIPDDEMWVANTTTGGYDLVEAVVVTFDADNVDGDTDVTTVKIQKGTTVTAPETDPEKDGFIFGGWFAPEVETAFDFDTEIDANVTLTAQWTAAAASVEGELYATFAEAVTAQ